MNMKETVKQNITKAMEYAEKATAVYNDENYLAIAYLNKAMYNMGAAQAAYYGNYTDMQNADIAEVFAAFDSFADAVVSFYVEPIFPVNETVFQNLIAAYEKTEYAK